jgi:hypothetical protein
MEVPRSQGTQGGKWRGAGGVKAAAAACNADALTRLASQPQPTCSCPGHDTPLLTLKVQVTPSRARSHKQQIQDLPHKAHKAYKGDSI